MYDLYKPVDVNRLMELAGVKEADMDDPIIRSRMGDTSVSTADIARASAEPLPPSKLTTSSGDPIASGTRGLNWNEQPKKAEPAPAAVTTPVPAPEPVSSTPLPAPAAVTTPVREPVNTNPEPETKIDPTLVVEPPKTGPRREPAGTGAVVGRTRLPGVSATPPTGSLAARKAAEIATRAPDPYGKPVTPAPKPGGFQSLTPPAAPYFKPSAPRPAAAPFKPSAPRPAAAPFKPSAPFTTTPGGAAMGRPGLRETSSDLARMQNLAGIRKN